MNDACHVDGPNRYEIFRIQVSTVLPDYSKLVAYVLRLVIFWLYTYMQGFLLVLHHTTDFEQNTSILWYEFRCEMNANADRRRC